MWLLGGYTQAASRQLLDQTDRKADSEERGRPGTAVLKRMRHGCESAASIRPGWEEGQNRAAEMRCRASGQVRIVHDCPRLSPQLCAHKLQYRLCQARARPLLLLQIRGQADGAERSRFGRRRLGAAHDDARGPRAAAAYSLPASA